VPRAPAVSPHLRKAAARWGLAFAPRDAQLAAPSRNETAVARLGRRRLLLKASRAPDDSGVDAEVAMLPLVIERLDGAREVRVPQLLFHAPGIAALAWLEGQTLFSVRRQTPAARVDARVGAALAALHARTAADGERLRPVVGDLVRRLVWTSPEVYAALGPASLQLWRHVQAQGAAEAMLSGLLDRERDGVRCLVHGDARQANVLVSKTAVALVDFEVAGRGDPARDVGMLAADDLADYLAPPPSAKAQTLATLRARLGGLYRGYTAAAARLRFEPGEDFFERTVGWTAEALLRRVYTITFHENRFASAEAHLTSAALALLAEPLRWGAHFFGRAG